MYNALDINTKEIIATAKTRAEASKKGAKIAGKEGYCVRPVEEAPAGEFFSIDSGFHRSRLLDGRII